MNNIVYFFSKVKINKNLSYKKINKIFCLFLENIWVIVSLYFLLKTILYEPGVIPPNFTEEN
jgi:hypothetical protein